MRDGLARGRAQRATDSAPVEGPWELPEGWRWARLGEVVELVSAKHKPDPQSTLEFVGMDAIAPWSMRIIRTEPFNTMRSAASAFKPGDVLYGRLRPYLNKVAKVQFEGACSGELLVLRAHQGLDADYLAYALHDRRYVDFTSRVTTGDRPRIGFDVMSAFELPVPPLETQRHIVARVDELFAEVDDGEAALARARSDLETWRKSLLKAAVTGELTAEWRTANPPTETGADLLARILADRRARWHADPKNKGKKYVEPASPNIVGVADLPEGWVWAGLEQLTTGGIRNGLSVKESTDPSEVRGLRLDALRPEGIDWARSRPLPISLERASAYLLRAGDLLISRANGSPEFVGRCSLVQEGRLDTVFPDTAIRYPLWGDQDFREWVRVAWSAPTSRKRLLKLAKSTAGILKISQSDIAAVALPIPPLAELLRINALMREIGEEASAGSENMDAFRSAPATLRQSILAAALRG